MKVSTDACLFGAWLASLSVPAARVLDIGCGTGLLMGMLAQASTARLYGIDIDEDAAAQATENMEASPWAERCVVIPGDVRTTPLPGPFDLILSNPPFFADQLKSPDARSNLARHSTALDLETLAGVMAAHLQPEGYTAVLLPHERADDWLVQGGMQGWRLVRRLDIRSSAAHPPLRACLLMQQGYAGAAAQEWLDIRQSGGHYTERATELLKPYYLYL